MTCGIYILKFKDTNKVYIGQSLDIENRYQEHKSLMRLNKSSKKLNKAYIEYGEPSLEILCECLKEELNNCENEAIDIFNSVSEGFNVKYEAGCRSELHGELVHFSTISNDTAIQILLLLVNTKDTLKEISLKLNVSSNIVKDISSLTSYRWLEEEYPEEYKKLKELKHSRNNGERSGTSVYTNKGIEEALLLLVSNLSTSLTELSKLSKVSYSTLKSIAGGHNHKWLEDVYPNEYKKLMDYKGSRKSGSDAKAQGKEYPRIKSPSGDLFIITNIKAFAREHNLNDTHLGRVLRGLEKQHKGWTLEV